MGEVQFLTTEQVLAIHGRMIDRYGGDPTIRDLGLIESAVMMPRQRFSGKYLHPTLASMAAAYLFHLCSNHGFVDGNKRTAVGAALVFIDANGYKLNLTSVQLERIALDVAGSKLEKPRLVKLFEAACRPRK